MKKEGFINFERNPSAPISQNNPSINDNGVIGYIPFGDSYTIGLGVVESHRWPNIMVENFAKEGINIRILNNPAVSGYTVRDMINYELSILKSIKPDFVTIFIGTNDSFAQTDVGIFEHNYKELLDKTQKLLPNPKSIVLITIPDYSKFPALKNNQNVSLSKFISSYNEVITKESIKRGLILVDIYPLSQEMTDEHDFIFDGLHPSRAGYMKWERVIFPKVKELLLR
ncbi:MAG TPA: SGNH/GDSL hydrolase family protein [Spirochaetia bacterium]|nr:SGNH/GDSL hydrolase family protein [Spirochaetia bacterium]